MATEREQFTGPGGLPMLRLTRGNAIVEVSTFGAHVTRYAVGGDEVLFLSGRAVLDGSKPIRGGVPICFPWFGGNGPRDDSPSHGFARTETWDVADATADKVTLRLADSAATRELWPHGFRLDYTVALGDALTLTFNVKNTEGVAFEFELALHTYLRVNDVRGVLLSGFDGCEYVDQLIDNAHKRQEGEPVVTSEIDRIYQGHTSDVTVVDGDRRIVVGKSGGASTVLWNPHVAKAKRLGDFGDDEWPQMLCVESAAIRPNAFQLAAGASHALMQTVRPAR